MSIFSYHRVKHSRWHSLKLIYNHKQNKKTNEYIHLEIMSAMKLGSPIFSKSRFISNEIIVIAQWKDKEQLNQFLEYNALGKILKKGWYLKLELIRQWGKITGFVIPQFENENIPDSKPIVAITIAKMKFTQIPRFLKWGRPVEKLVRDHTGTLVSLASIKYPHTISTFSIWKNQIEMTNMVHGHSKVPKPKRHSKAMKERERKDFHFEFTTLRFKPLTEVGQWEGKTYL